jgi:diguanylate cyclase (GGDEF)-like protein
MSSRNSGILSSNALFAVAGMALLLLAIFVAGVWQLWLLQENLNRQSALVSAAVTERDRLLQLVNEETGVRGYVATADPGFLKIYAQSLPREMADEVSIRLAIFDVPTLWPELLRSHTLAQREQRYFSEEVRLVQSGFIMRARHNLAAGKTLFDRLRNTDALVEQQVTGELRAQQAHTLFLVRAGLAAGVVLCCVLVLSGIGFAFVLRRARIYRTHALSDPLTGAANHRGAAVAIQDLTDAKRSPFGLVFIDLDGFKKINDVYGHAAGDTILRQVALRLRAELRERDEVCRLGGDEFLCIVSPPADAEQVRRVAERLRKAVNRPYETAGDQYVVGCSVGVSMYPQHGETAAVLLERADRAMYLAKSSGGGVREATAM